MKSMRQHIKRILAEVPIYVRFPSSWQQEAEDYLNRQLTRAYAKIEARKRLNQI